MSPAKSFAFNVNAAVFQPTNGTLQPATTTTTPASPGEPDSPAHPVEAAVTAVTELDFDELHFDCGRASEAVSSPRTPRKPEAETAEATWTVGPEEQAVLDAERLELEAPCPGDVHCTTAGEEGPNGADTPAARVGPRDFELLKVVGQGAFGKVFQVRKRDTRCIYAMKVMRKQRVMEKDHGEYVRAERNVLTSIVHPYIVTLQYSFQTASKLYLVLDFINGGHLFFQLYRVFTFPEDLARLYTAEIVLAIAHLHERGIIHRDLKPENVLLDSDGHVKVTDFGLAKIGLCVGERSNSFIGTMEYMAPEVVSGAGHGKEVDWWSTGILLYEMLSGLVPFRAKSKIALQKQILTAKFKLEKFWSTSAASLLRGLLQRDPPARLGSGPDGSANVKNHPFFRSINWEALEKRQIESPFKPSLQHSASVENFDKIWTDLKPVDSPCGTPRGKATPPTLPNFEGFSYEAPSLLREDAGYSDYQVMKSRAVKANV